jgi:uncharacterized protein
VRLSYKKPAVPEFLQVPWSIRDLVVFVVAWIGIQFILVMLMAAVSPWIPPLAQFLDAARGGDLRAVFALNLVDAGIGLGVIAWLLRRYQANWTTLGWRRTSLLRSILYLFIIMIVFVVGANLLLYLVSVLVPTFDANQAQENDFLGATGSQQSLALIALVLLPPILEETIFRGFIFPAIAKRAGLVWGAIISSVIFGLAHWQANIGIYTFLLGLLLCFMYVRLRSIVPGIVLHMINNSLAFIALSQPRG